VLGSHAKLFAGIQKLFDAMACTILIFMPNCTLMNFVTCCSFQNVVIVTITIKVYTADIIPTAF